MVCHKKPRNFIMDSSKLPLSLNSHTLFNHHRLERIERVDIGDKFVGLTSVDEESDDKEENNANKYELVQHPNTGKNNRKLVDLGLFQLCSGGILSDLSILSELLACILVGIFPYHVSF